MSKVFLLKGKFTKNENAHLLTPPMSFLTCTTVFFFFCWT